MLVEESSLALEFDDAATRNIFIGKEPPNPDNIVIIFDTYGRPPYLGLTDVGYEYPSLQIMVRNRNYQTGWTLINDIKDLLHGRAHETWNGTLYELITSSTPVHLDWDDNDRARFIINVNLQRK
jgi:hypothetical protein